MKKKVIIFSEIKWDFLWQRHHEVTNFFLRKGHQVIFVERVISRFPDLKELFRRFLRQLNSDKTSKKNLKENKLLRIKKSFFLPNTNIFFRLWNFLHWYFFWRKLQRESLIYSFVDNTFVIGNNFEKNNKERIIVFDVIHNWWKLPWNQNIHQRDCNKFLEYSNKVVTDSALMFEFLNKEKEIEKLHLMQPGVSPNWIDKSTNDNYQGDLYNILFFGNLRHNSDIEIFKILSNDKRVKIHIFGMIHEEANHLLKIENIVFFGKVSPDEITNQIKNYQFVLLPYSKESFNETLIPNKYYECCATGMPILSNSYMSHLPKWGEFSYEIKKENIFLQLQDILREHKLKKRDQIDLALQNIWEKNLNQMYEFILND